MEVPFTLSEEYWENFQLNSDDIEFLYNHLLEIEIPLTPQELLSELLEDRIQREKRVIEKQRTQGGDVYFPKDAHEVGTSLVFPALDWQAGTVTASRPAESYLTEEFSVIQVEFSGGDTREFASGLQAHSLNDPVEPNSGDPNTSPDEIISTYGDGLTQKVIDELSDHDDFVYIAGRWFPTALIVDVNAGNLNLAEALLDMEKGGPLSTAVLLEQVGLPDGVNPNLAAFSLDLALQNDPRFDEVGPAGEVAWYLNRLEPESVLKPPMFLRYSQSEYDTSVITDEMRDLERRLDDEISPIEGVAHEIEDTVEVRLIFPHWRSGTLPLSSRVSQLFPTAYESPRIRIKFVDGETGEKFSGWVVRLEKYVYGLSEWYKSRGLMCGSYVQVRRGENPGEVIVQADSHRSKKEWIRTALVGADGKVVYATLKQAVSTSFDPRMGIALPSDLSSLDSAWEARQQSPPPFEKAVVDTMRELAKLNPQSHVHFTELYSGMNLEYRTPPGPIMALLASRPWFVHVGDMHYRIEDAERE